jgi:hypothetical protein
MKRKLDFNLSASTINYFCTCPWAFAQDKVYKRHTIELPSTALVLGQAFHKLLQWFYSTQTWRTYDLFQKWEQIFDVEAKLQNNKLPGLKYAKASGFTILKNWVALAKANGWLHEAFTFDSGIKGIEYEFKLPYDNGRFEVDVHGFMDLVIECNGRIYILDWKTGKHSKAKYFLQAVLYSWALYKKHGLIEDCVRFVHPSKDLNTVIDIKVHDENYDLIVRATNTIFDAIEQNKFSKNVGDHCKWCKWIDCPSNTNEGLKQLIEQME